MEPVQPLGGPLSADECFDFLSTVAPTEVREHHVRFAELVDPLDQMLNMKVATLLGKVEMIRATVLELPCPT